MTTKFNMSDASLQELASKMKSQFDGISEDGYRPDCGCGDYCECYYDMKAVDADQFGYLGQLINEFNRRMDIYG